MANEHSQIVPDMQPTSTVADFKFWCQKVLPLVYDDSLSYYEVLNKMVVFLNQVIDNINADTANVAELEADFLLLQTYVNTFFDDIDQLATYAQRAEDAQTAAATSATNAASSASNAASSASNAASSSLSAMDARDAAIAAKTAAQTALTNAQTAATNAANSATAASGSATAASGSATNAATSATAAQTAATSAESDATSAASSAAEAVAAVGTVVNGLGNISKTIENVPVASTEDALASIAKKVVVDIEPVQSGSGDPSPTNIRPITGWTGTNVTRTGKNLFSTEFEQGGIDTLSGNKVDSSVRLRTKDLILLKAGSYTFSCKESSVLTAMICIYNIKQEYVKPYGSVPGTPNFIRIPTRFTLTEDSYVRFSATISSTTTVTPSNISDVMLEQGATATEYTPNQGITYGIEFPVEAGTVYGGTLENNGTDSWTLTVTHAYDTVSNLSVYAALINGTYSSMKRYTLSPATTECAYNKRHGIISNMGVEQNVYYGTNRTNASESATINFAVDQSGIVLAIYDPDTTITDADFNTKYDNMTVCYPLATPATYTLTDEDVVTLLYGTNNVWADTGNINTLEYFTNAENYVTSQVDLAKALIAPVLKEMKADTALSVNDFRIVGNTLYKVTANIASGATLTIGTNVTATTIGEQITALLNA